MRPRARADPGPRLLAALAALARRTPEAGPGWSHGGSADAAAAQPRSIDPRRRRATEPLRRRGAVAAALPADAPSVRRLVDARARRRDVRRRSRRPAPCALQSRAPTASTGWHDRLRRGRVARRAPATLLIGDVALAYDTRRAAGAAARASAPADDRGARQRRRRDLRLPAVAASQRDVFEEPRRNSHRPRPSRAAALYGRGTAPSRPRASSTPSWPRGGHDDLLHVRTDRAENVALHRRVSDGGRRRPVTVVV